MPDRITFINHATVLVELGGATILTDPVYSFSISYFLPRLKRPGIPFDSLPSIDIVAVSHNHYDHLNFRTLRKLGRRDHPSMVVSSGDGRYARRLGFDPIHELQWWESVKEGNVRITCVPARHASGRTPWNRGRSKASGYVFEADGKAVYFSGDTAPGYFFSDIGKRFSLDVALLPIGAYKPLEWFKDIHLNPSTAIEAFRLCKANVLIPIHWGTFKISDEPMSEPPQLLREEAQRAGLSDRVKILENGEGMDL